MSEDRVGDDEAGPGGGGRGRRYKPSHVILAVLALLVGVWGVTATLLHAGERAAPWFQQAAFGGHHGRGQGMMIHGLCGSHRTAWVDERIELIEGFVDVTPEQEPAWQALTQAARAGQERVGQACSSLQEAGQGPVGRITQIEIMLAAGLDVVRVVRPAFEDFYAVLDEDQKAALDRLVRRHGRAG